MYVHHCEYYKFDHIESTSNSIYYLLWLIIIENNIYIYLYMQAKKENFDYCIMHAGTISIIFCGNVLNV